MMRRRSNLRSQGPALCTMCSFFSSSPDLLCFRHRNHLYTDSSAEHIQVLRRQGCDVQEIGGELYTIVRRCITPTSARMTLLALREIIQTYPRTYMDTIDGNTILALLFQHFGYDEITLTAIGAHVVLLMSCPWNLDIACRGTKSSLLCYHGAYGEPPVVGTPLGLDHVCFQRMTRSFCTQRAMGWLQSEQR